MINTNLKLRFKPVSHSWVALHPQPKGVIQREFGLRLGARKQTFMIDGDRRLLRLVAVSD